MKKTLSRRDSISKSVSDDTASPAFSPRIVTPEVITPTRLSYQDDNDNVVHSSSSFRDHNLNSIMNLALKISALVFLFSTWLVASKKHHEEVIALTTGDLGFHDAPAPMLRRALRRGDGGGDDKDVDDSNEQDNSPAKYNRMTDPWTERRKGMFETFYEFGSTKLKRNADEKGPVLDFLIGGWPKCGTTTLEANLGYYAPMPIADVCTPVHQAVYYSHQNWPKEYDPNGTKPLRGSKCPSYVDNMKEITTYLPKTKMIFGIRHPVMWFESFWNMLARNDKQYTMLSPYNKTEPCVKGGARCRNQCPEGQLACMYRAQFHTSLARMGKTPLTDEERQLVAPNQYYGGQNLENYKVSNPIFLYEMSQMKEDHFWQELAEYLNIPEIKNERYHSSRGIQKDWGDSARIQICDAQYDDFRKLMMPIAHEMSQWLYHHFRLVAEDPNRPDVVVPNATRFFEIVRGYSNDPCNRLRRNKDGTYELKPKFASSGSAKSTS